MDSISVREANRLASKSGSYRFVEVIGNSSFGTVLQARRGSYGPIMAIHLIQQQRINAKDIEGLRSLNHPSIVAFVESYPCFDQLQNGHTSQKQKRQPPKVVSMVLEYCRTGDLASYLKSYRVPESTRLRWYADLASGLEFLHGRGVMHNDLKPENIWIKNDTLKLANIGVASTIWLTRQKEDNSDQPYCHFIRDIDNSKPMLAPEVWADKHSCTYNKSTEVFGLALLFLLVCESPDEGHAATWADKTDFIGRLLYTTPATRTLKGSHIITPPIRHCRPQETNLFDLMLQFDMNSRPDMPTVVKIVSEFKPTSYLSTTSWSPWCSC